MRTLATIFLLGAFASGCGSCNCGGGPGSDSGPGVTYWAEGLPTGLIRIAILKADSDRDLCFQIILVSPALGTGAVTTPADWGVEGIAVSPGSETCVGGLGTGPDTVFATDATGVIDFLVDPVAGLPCTIDVVDLVASFPPDAPWVPTTEPFLAFDVPIGPGC